MTEHGFRGELQRLVVGLAQEAARGVSGASWWQCSAGERQQAEAHKSFQRSRDGLLELEAS